MAWARLSIEAFPRSGLTFGRLHALFAEKLELLLRLHVTTRAVHRSGRFARRSRSGAIAAAPEAAPLSGIGVGARRLRSSALGGSGCR
jgi:hypothetical protein